MNLRSLKKVNMEVQIIFIAHSDKKKVTGLYFLEKITPLPLLKPFSLLGLSVRS